jgi:hypothetical protein
MKRREFIARLGATGTFAAVPGLARAQQGTRLRRIGVLIEWLKLTPRQRPASPLLHADFRSGVWTDGRNVRMDVRFGSGNIDRIGALAKEKGLSHPGANITG